MRITQTHPTEDLLGRYAAARRKAEDAQREVKLLEEELAARMVKEQRKSAELHDGGKLVRVTYVQGETTSIDEAGLKKALGAAEFRKYTQEKLDKKKLEDALDRGDVDPIVVGQYVKVNPSRPYLRFTEKEHRDDEH